MADTETGSDKVEVTFIKQTVFHDGTNMHVKKDGDTLEVDRSRVQGFIDGKNIEKPEGWEEAVAEANSQGVADGGFTVTPPDGSGNDLPQLDHDGNGEPGGSAPHVPVSLTGKNKADLLQIAFDEEVVISEGATNADIVKAIEAKREADAEAGEGEEGAPA